VPVISSAHSAVECFGPYIRGFLLIFFFFWSPPAHAVELETVISLIVLYNVFNFVFKIQRGF